MRALVTGGSRGLGRDLAERFGPDAVAWLGRGTGDITDPTAVRRLAAELGEIDLLVNVAGVAKLRHTLMQPTDDAREMALTNLFGTWLVSREVGRLMLRHRHGAIVNISSIYSRQCPAGAAMYAATKAGIEAMTTCMAKELAPFGITVNCLALSPYDTETMRATGTPEQIAATIDALSPARLANVEDVYEAIMALVGKPMVTGQTLYLGGVR
jgi:3-oxoacyl-[acyl-carrier protein] reductase